VRVDTGLADEGMIGHNFEAHMADLQKRMLQAASNLEFEEAGRLRDEIKRLRETELVLADDPLARQEDVEDRAGRFAGSTRPGAPSGSRARKPTLDEMGARGEVPAGSSGRVQGPAGLSMRSLARRNSLDEMTVGRTEVPLGGPKPQKPVPASDVPGVTPRGNIGTGSYEDPTEERRRKGRAKKSGRPGR
jgi:excinuclease ABC subunit B